MRNVSWQILALAGGLLVAVSVAIPGGESGGPSGNPTLGASLEVHVDENGEVNALVDVDPGANVLDVVFFSPNEDVRLAADVDHEDLVWSVVGTTLLPEGCFTVSAELLLGPAGAVAPTNPKKLKVHKHASPKQAKAKPSKSKKGRPGAAPAAAGPSSIVLTTMACLPEPECPACEQAECAPVECPVCEVDPIPW